MMGCYGIGITRALSAIIEKNHDEKGIVWPQSVTPFKIIIIPLDNSDSIMNIAGNVYKDLLSNNIETLIDDRNLSSGIKFNDANLIGIPYRILLGKRESSKGKLEIEERKTMNKYSCDINEAIRTYKNIINSKQ
jgi:prolyl-tRNA synthetase